MTSDSYLFFYVPYLSTIQYYIMLKYWNLINISVCVCTRNFQAKPRHCSYTLLKALRTKAKIIDGKKIAEDIRKELKVEIDEWVDRGHRPPCLCAILVGNDPASEKYVQFKMLAAKDVGIKSSTIRLPETSTEEEIISKVRELNNDPNVDGILVQLPVPEGVSERNVCNAVDPRKDVDGFHITNIGKLTINMDTFVPATALAVVELLKRSHVKTFGKNIVVCGRSKNVGLPMALILHSDARNQLSGGEGTVVICHRNTPPEDLAFYAKKADIIISATGVVNLITADIVKPGACIIDVGITRITTPEGRTKIVGDVDFNAVSKVAGHITPVPGGVGPMTVAMLMKNTYKAAVQIANENNITS